MKKISFLASLALLFLLNLFFYLAAEIPDNNLFLDFLYNLPALVAVIAGYLLVRQFGISNLHGRAFAYITMGVSFMLLGDIIWSVKEHVFHLSGFPSFIDVIYLSAYPLYFWGFLLEYRSDRTKIISRKAVITVLISLALAGFSIYNAFFLAYSIDNSFYENLFGIFYALADTVISILLIMIFMKAISFEKGKLFFPWLFIFIGFLFNVLADTIYSIFFDVYQQGGTMYVLLDLLWIVGYLFLALGLGLIFYVIRDVQTDIKLKLEKK